MDKQLISDLITRKDEHIAMKKAIQKNCDFVDMIKTVTKFDDYESKDDLNRGMINRKIVGNTYNWLDSHGDVHIDGVFTKSINENKQRIMHLHDHIYQLDAKVGHINDITEKSMQWRDLGINKDGFTQSLIIDSNIQKSLNANIYNQYVSGQINQHSVGMRYVKIDLAINDIQFPEEYVIWNKHIAKIGNANKAIEQGYFWAVTEAKLIEVSAVIAGSNELTPTLEPSKSEPSKDTQKETLENKGINYKYLIDNFKI